MKKLSGSSLNKLSHAALNSGLPWRFWETIER